MFGWLSVRPISASRWKRSRNSGLSSRLASGRLSATTLGAPLGLVDGGHAAAAEQLEQPVLAEPLAAALVDARAGVHERSRSRERARVGEPHRRGA